MITGQPVALTSPPINNHIPQVPPQLPANNLFSSIPQGVPLSYVIHRLIEQSYTNLLQLSESLVDKSDEQRKKSLVKYLEGTRERFIRLLVLVKWAHYLPNLTNAANIINFLNQQDFFLRDAADSLCHLHTRLYTARAPGYDIPTAIDVLTTGTYQRLPTVIKQTAKKAPLSDSEVASTMQRLDDLLCFRLLSSTVPKQFTSVTVANGRVILTVSDEYTVHLTVNGEEMNDPWQVLSLHLLLRPHSHKDKGTQGTDVIMADKDEDGVLPALHIRRVIDLVTLRMAESAKPLVELHTIVHHLVVTLMMDILRTQAQTLRIIAPTPPTPPGPPGQPTPPPPLIVNYWTDNPTHPSLKIRVDPATTNLVIEHHPNIKDPLTSADPQFKLIPTAISIENLLMQAMRHHARSRIYTLAQRMAALPLLANCVDTKDRDYVSVTLFGGWQLVIGVDYASGRFIARDSSLPADLIPNLEESFNADPASIPDSALQLRIRAAVSYIERITHAIPLEAFRTLPIYNQNSPTTSSTPSTTYNTLYLRYPAIEPNVHYHLCVTVAPNLTPTFTLVKVNTTIPLLPNNTLIASTGDSNPQHSVYPIPVTVKQPITERTYDKAVGGAISIGAQRRAYLMIVSELDALSFPHQIGIKKKPGTNHREGSSEVGIQVSLPEPLPFSPVLLPSLPRTPPFTSFSLSPIYFPQDHPFLPSPSHMGWQIVATETNPKPSVNTAHTKTITHGKGYGDISCINDTWTFTYNILATSSGTENGRSINRPGGTVNRSVNKRDPAAESIVLRLFVQDVHGVAAIREIHSAIDKIVTGSDLADFFKIHAVGPTAIHIVSRGEGFPECTTSIEWKGAAGITVDFSPTTNPFSLYLQRILTSAPAADASTYQPIVSFLLHVRHSLELVHHVAHYIAHPAIELLPGDIVIIPRSGNLLRVVYRNSFGIDFRISHWGIQMEDAGEPGPFSGLGNANNRERIPQQKITNFALFMEEKKALIGNPIQPSAIPTALRTIHSYMGILWLYRACVRIFAELTEPSPVSNPANPSTAPILLPNVKSEHQAQRLTLKVTMHGVQYIFMVLHYETFEIYPAPLPPPSGTSTSTSKYMDQGLLPSNAFGLSAPEAEAIAQFWRENVASPPYRPTSLISFIRILALPIVPLKEFAEIMKMSQSKQGDRDAERVTLCLSHTVGSKHRDAVLHLATTNEINFILRFVPPHHITHSHPKPLSSSLTSLTLSSTAVRAAEPHSTTMEMGLRYQYTTHNLRVWNGVSGGGAEEDAAHSDMLERAIARARISEPEHPGMLPTLPAVVRALLFLRNPSSVP